MSIEIDKLAHMNTPHYQMNCWHIQQPKEPE